MSISSVITLGYGQGVNFLPTLGYSSGAAPPPTPTITGGHFLPQGANKKKRTWSNVNVVYEKARALPRVETKELRDAVSEFVEPKIARQTVVPELSAVDYAALEANQRAYDKFIEALDNIQNNIVALEEKQNEDDELFQLAILACTIQ